MNSNLPPGKLPPNPVLEPEVTRFQALLHFGLFAAHDVVMFILIVFVWLTLLAWWAFGQPTAVNLLALGLVNVFLTQAWVIVLAYRALVFILDLHAEITLMPEAAARIVRGFQESGVGGPK